MPVYNNICIVCQRKFVSTRIDAVYCPDKQVINGIEIKSNCRSRARSLPDNLKESLIRRNRNFKMKATSHVADVYDAAGRESAIGYIPEGATKENPLGKDEGLVLALIREMKQKKDDDIERERLKRKYDPQLQDREDNSNEQKGFDSTVDSHSHGISNISNSGFGSKEPDVEMLAQQFELPEDMIPVLSVKETENNEENKQKEVDVQSPSKKYKFSGFRKSG